MKLELEMINRRHGKIQPTALAQLTARPSPLDGPTVAKAAKPHGPTSQASPLAWRAVHVLKLVTPCSAPVLVQRLGGLGVDLSAV
jgi:hypothetical protein